MMNLSFISPKKSSDQNGQSIVEFVASIGVLVAFLIGIPIVAKIANINIMSIQALDYATWRVREGNTDNNQLTQEVSDRYFGETALVVSGYKIENAGVRLGTGKNYEQIYQKDTVNVAYIPKPNIPKVDGVLKNQYKLPLSDEAGEVVINVPLENLDVLSEIPSSMTIKNSLYIDNQSLTARDGEEIKQRMGEIKETIVPYNNGIQRKSYRILNNTVISALNLIPILREYKLKDVSISESTLPQDRFAEYKK